MQGDSALRYMYIGDNYGTECVIRFDFRHLLLSIEQKRCTCRKHTSPRRPLVHLNNKFEKNPRMSNTRKQLYCIDIVFNFIENTYKYINLCISSICHCIHVYHLYYIFIYFSNEKQFEFEDIFQKCNFSSDSHVPNIIYFKISEIASCVTVEHD